VPGGPLGSLDAALADFLDALAALNRELNGPIPSERIGGPETIPIDVEYAVANVADMLRKHGERTAKETWMVETAWLAVLARDIDDLAEHLELEWSWRE
jgi:hypothetical protein